MLKRLVWLILVALVGWIVYVSVLGDDTDKAKRDALLGNAKDFGKSIVDVFSHESEKIKDGTYDEVLNKLDSAIDQLKKADNKGEYKTKLEDLLAEKKRLEKLIAEAKQTDPNAPQNRSSNDPQEQNNKDLKKLAEDITKLAEEMEKK